MKVLLLIISMLMLVVCCSSSVKVIKNDKPYYEKTVEINVLDKALVRLPFEPAYVKVYGTDNLTATWNKNEITIKALEEGDGKVGLFDEDNIELGAIKVIVEARDQ